MIDAKMKNCQILLVDDEQAELDAYSLLLMSMGIRNVTTLNDSRRVLQVLEGMASPILFLDLNMPNMSGQDVLREMKAKKPQIPVIIITANSEIETAVECLRLGAHDYLVKPIDLKMFSSALRNALEIGLLRNEVMSLKGISFDPGPHANPAFKPIITQDPVMFGIFQYIESIAGSGLPTLILGETGSGKELIARAIHEVSGLTGEFVAVDISGLDDTLFSDTLFGHTRGAFTGADSGRSGLLEKARGGTIFLDEIGDLSEVSQVKLLRLLQEKIYYPLGSDQPEAMSGQGHHRRQQGSQQAGGPGRAVPHGSLLSSEHPSHPPAAPARPPRRHPSARRVSDCRGRQRPCRQELSRQSAAKLCVAPASPLLGNIRELKTYIFDAVARCGDGEISDRLLSGRLAGAALPSTPVTPPPPAGTPLETVFGRFPTLDELTDFAVKEALASSGNNQSQAARLLGISKQALHKRLKKTRT
jgi:DNA-binding NtrC family response regulator